MRIPVRKPSGRAYFPRRGRPLRKPVNRKRPSGKPRPPRTVAGRLHGLRRSALAAVNGLAGFTAGKAGGKRHPRRTARR